MAESVVVPGFEIDHMIARGGMATVYLARQNTLGRDVALKVMDKNEDPSFSERFLNEGRLIASFQHPNVITIHDLGLLDDGKAFISMEYVVGGDLEARMMNAVSEDDALDILRNLAGCLDYVHDHGVVHRDIKPANILFRKDGSLVLTDFGIAKKLDKDVKLTRDGVAVGSPGYMSPEQARATEVDRRSDIYSVGVIFTEMLLGENVFEADSYIQTSMNHIQMDIPMLEVHHAKYQLLIDRMLAKDPDDRFEDARALLSYLSHLEQKEKDLEARESAQSSTDSRYKPFFPADGGPGDDSTLTFEQVQAMREAETNDNVAIKKATSSLYVESDGKVFWAFLVIFIAAGVVFFQHVTKDKQVDDLLENAQKAYNSDKLMLPENASAYFYYQEVLKIDEENADAQEGMSKMAERYVQLANSAYRKGSRKNAANFVARGLVIEPENEKLLKLKKKMGL